MRQLHYGEGYHYAHDDYDVEQLNLPSSLADRRYYTPRKQGAERIIAERDAEKRRRPE
jgi:putative ATPase